MDSKIKYIDSMNEVDLSEVTIENLNIQARTAGSRVKGAGEARDVRYRMGISCKLGNVEASVWRDLAKAVVIRDLGRERLDSVILTVREKGTPAERKDEETILATALERCISQAQ